MDPLGAILSAVLGRAGRHWKLLVVAGLAAALTLQTWRVDRLKGELVDARAAQRNPVTGASWRSEAERDGRALGVCRGNVGRLEADIAARNVEIERWRADGAALTARAAAEAKAKMAARAVAESASRAAMETRVDAATCEAREAAMAAVAREAAR